MENLEGMDQAMTGLNEAVDAANKLAQNATLGSIPKSVYGVFLIS